MASIPYRPKSPVPKLDNPSATHPEVTNENVKTEEQSKKDGPKLQFAGPSLSRRDSKRSSLSFNILPHSKPSTPQEEVTPPAPLTARRAPSPPPQRTYSRGVSFDTFDNRDATDFSFTLNYKHKNYHHSRRSRTFLCGTDQKDYSEFALEWLIDELVDDGDEIICLRAVDKDSKLVTDATVDKNKYREEAQKLLNQVVAKNAQEEKAISIVLELAVGKVQDIIQRMIQIYEPAVLIVGTRGRSLNGMQGLLPGSVSKYCLQQSPIPVIVVRPSNKRMKKKKKRLADPSRRDYNHILSRSEVEGSNILQKPVRDSMFEVLPTATDQEAAAVARAIGISQAQLRQQEENALTRVTSARSEMTSDAESPSPEGPLSPETNAVVLKSPKLKPLDELPVSAAEEEDEDDYDEVEEEEDIVDKFSKNKRTPSVERKKKKRRTTDRQPGKAVGAVVDEVVPKKPPPPPSWDSNNAGQNILDMLDEMTG